jgi:hypothetical protein
MKSSKPINENEPRMAPVAKPSLDEALHKRLEEMEQRLQAAESEAETYRQTVEGLEATIAEARNSGETIEPHAEVKRDPWADKNPFKFKADIEPDDEYPHGQKLGWKNYKTRQNRRQWRGWEIIEYGDKYAGKEGELLSKYMNDPPPRMKGPDRIDNKVRRADLVLCRLDMEIWKLRQQEREDKSNQAAKREGSPATINVGQGIKVVGSGLTTDTSARR